GIHTAEPSASDEGYYGIGVHRAARIMAAAHGGQMLVSLAASSVLEDAELDGARLRDLGEYWLKDLDRPERLYQLDASGLQQIFPRGIAWGRRAHSSRTLRVRDRRGGRRQDVAAATVLRRAARRAAFGLGRLRSALHAASAGAARRCRGGHRRRAPSRGGRRREAAGRRRGVDPRAGNARADDPRA